MARIAAALLVSLAVLAGGVARADTSTHVHHHSCKGGDLTGYPNGRLPVSALCPLYGAPGHLLRADAARAFNKMSHAYEKQFGHPICVTDSYRSYDAQVLVHEKKPDITAVPGTSNHGWGRAVDLCDGVNDFGTTTYDWMVEHAPDYRWCHPDWAEPTGSRPEPWHWEYSPRRSSPHAPAH